MTFADLVDRYIGLSFRKQLALADFLGKHSFQVSLSKGTVDFGKGPGLFGKRRVYPIQVLGTEAEDSGTWLWAWANEASHIPAGLLEAVGRVRSYGEAKGVAELTTAQLPSREYPGHLLSLVASGIAGADAYYRGPYLGGAAFFLVGGTPLAQPVPTPQERIARVLMEVISNFDVQHRAMARSYLKAEGFRLDEDGSVLSAAGPAGQSLRIEFDDQGRIANVNALIRGDNR